MKSGIHALALALGTSLVLTLAGGCSGDQEEPKEPVEGEEGAASDEGATPAEEPAPGSGARAGSRACTGSRACPCARGRARRLHRRESLALCHVVRAERARAPEQRRESRPPREARRQGRGRDQRRVGQARSGRVRLDQPPLRDRFGRRESASRPGEKRRQESEEVIGDLAPPLSPGTKERRRASRRGDVRVRSARGSRAQGRIRAEDAAAVSARARPERPGSPNPPRRHSLRKPTKSAPTSARTSASR